jgi:hypothetical protein
LILLGDVHRVLRWAEKKKKNSNGVV